MLFVHRAITTLVVTVGFGACSAPWSVQGPFPVLPGKVVELRNAGYAVNGPGAELSPVISDNGKALYYLGVPIIEPSGMERSQPSQSSWLLGGRQVIRRATKPTAEDTAFSMSEELKGAVNAFDRPGGIAVAADGSYAVEVICDHPDGEGDCDIFQVTGLAGTAPSLTQLETINGPYWDSNPTLSSDGRTLLFSSNRIGSTGGRTDFDIYYSTRQPDGSWSEPRNLGSPINTPYTETAPALAFGDSVLFFASQGRPGSRGFDLYACFRKADGSWGDPINLGAPINSPGDEQFISFAPDGRTFSFSSTRRNLTNYGSYDIYVGRLIE